MLKVAGDQRLLEFVADQDVGRVGDFVGIHADEARLHLG